MRWPTPATAMRYFREATWEEALAHAGRALRRIRGEYGPRALAGFGCAKGSNEEAYLFQKLVRLGFGSNNVDHCTRLCHASSVAALLEGLGSGAVSNPVMDVTQAEVVLVIGANPDGQPPGGGELDQERGAPRHAADRHRPAAQRTGAPRPALPALQARQRRGAATAPCCTSSSTEGLTDERFIAERTLGFEAMREHVRDCSPEWAAPLTGIDAADDPRGGAPVRHQPRVDDPVGHGHQPARARHRQRALPHRAGAGHGADRPPRHRAAPAARPEQRAGRFRRGADPDDVPRLPARHRRRRARALRRRLGRAGREARRADWA